jgi:hypothetical protein
MYSLIAILPALALQLGECRYSEPRTANIDVSAAQRVVISAGAGDLEVVGRPGLRQARIRATACASDRALLAEINLTATRSGNGVRIHANDEERQLSGNEYARLDVVIELPAGIAADISDGSGDVVLSGLGALILADGSGDIDVSDLTGSVAITDGSGEITLRDVQGEVEIEDGSGEITVTGVTRDVHINDASGGITVDNVGGSFTVGNDGSGDVDYRAIRGAVRIPTRRR